MTHEEKTELIAYIKETKIDLDQALRALEITDDRQCLEAEISDTIFRCARCGRWRDVAVEESNSECLDCTESLV